MMASLGDACLDDGALESLQHGELDAGEAGRVRSHLEQCVDCARRARNLAKTVASIGRREPRESVTQPDAALEKAGRLSRGQTVGRYVVLDPVGAGGMGDVYSAFDPELDRKVAIKVLKLAESVDKDDVRTRMQREAQALARLSHPHVVAVHDVGWLPDGRMFLTVELVTGTTLKKWQRESKRNWRAVLEVYIAAGRGLAAAHRAGLVHRDFKPANVLMGNDGSVKVTDFGLARAVDAASDSMRPPPLPPGTPQTLDRTPSKAALPNAAQAVAEASSDATPPTPPPSLPSNPSSKPLHSEVTETGTILGTPGYMAPEQYMGQRTDARSDQFSFCISLFEGLYGVRPFAGKDLDEVADAVLGAKMVRVPEGGVPPWVRRLVTRGLSTDPTARFASLDELLEALSHDPRKARIRAAMAVAGAAAMAGLFILARHGRTSQLALCTGAQAEMSEVWSDDVRTRVDRAFSATGASFAPDTWQRTRDALDGYASHWVKAHRQTCEATRIRGEQSEAVMTVRMTCLEQRREQLQALVHVLSEADRKTVERSLDAVGALPGVAGCDDVAALSSVVPLPTDPTQRTTIDGIRHDLAAARALSTAGRLKEAMAQVEPLIERARTAGYSPVLAEAMYVEGVIQQNTGAVSLAAETLREAAYAAEQGRNDELKVHALSGLVTTLADTSRFDEAKDKVRFAKAAAARLTTPEAYQPEILKGEAMVLERQGKHAEAYEVFQRALESAEHVPEPKPLDVALLCSTAGGVAGRANRFDDALRLLDRADELMTRLLGPDHPRRSFIQSNKASALIKAGRPTESLAATDLGLAIAARAGVPPSGAFAVMHDNRADALLELGRDEEALAEARLAVEVGSKAYGPTSAMMGTFQLAVAEALQGLGRASEAAALYGEWVSRFEATAPDDHESLADGRAGLGEARLALRDGPGAARALEAAVKDYESIPELTPADQRKQARALLSLAQARSMLGVPGARAPAPAMEAAAIYRRLGDEDGARGVEAWLRSRGGSGP
jgi:serine/threonine protein kinase/tetratricopeptide (TPR) repeat protein